ncbi:MAG: hypothetical protein ABW252_14195 [Polyangiales bacterium]
MNRDLGGCERFYWVANQWSANNVVAVCELGGTLDVACLRAALALLRVRHPALGLCVLADAEGRDPRFVRRPRGVIPLDVEGSGATPFPARVHAATERALNERIDAAETLVRVRYLHGEGVCAVVLTALHIIADATAAMVALRDLLALVAAVTRDPAATAAALPIAPALAALLPPRLSGVRALPRVARTQAAVAIEQLRAAPTRLPAEREVPLTERRNRLIQKRLAPRAVEGLRAACAEAEVTVHGLLLAALAIAVAEELGLRGLPRAMLSVGSPVSVRTQLVPRIGDAMGSFVATLSVLVDAGRDASIWSIARAANRELERRKARDEPLAMMCLAQWATPATLAGSAGFMRMAEQQGPGNVCLSNIGALAFPPEVAGIAVRAAHWTASLSVTGYFLCAVCTTPQGLSLDFSFIEGVVGAARAERIVDRMLARVVDAAEVHA